MYANPCHSVLLRDGQPDQVQVLKETCVKPPASDLKRLRPVIGGAALGREGGDPERVLPQAGVLGLGRELSLCLNHGGAHRLQLERAEAGICPLCRPREWDRVHNWIDI